MEHQFMELTISARWIQCPPAATDISGLCRHSRSDNRSFNAVSGIHSEQSVTDHKTRLTGRMNVRKNAHQQRSKLPLYRCCCNELRNGPVVPVSLARTLLSRRIPALLRNSEPFLRNIAGTAEMRIGNRFILTGEFPSSINSAASRPFSASRLQFGSTHSMIPTVR